ncbi:MAG: pilus assembly protein N-terminal domain-containing protein, partial [Cyanobacteria bacterium]|nr:pilus assembly protein N-terminal domain-containing protein [Cyanobacteriota bacterium]
MIFKKTVVLGVSTLILGTAASFPVSYGQGFPLDFRQFGFNHFTPTSSNHLGNPLAIQAQKVKAQNTHIAGSSLKTVPNAPLVPPHAFQQNSAQQNVAKVSSPIVSSSETKASISAKPSPKASTTSVALPSTPIHGTTPQAVPAGTHQASVNPKMMFKTVAQKKVILESNSPKLTANHVFSHPRTLAIPVSHRTPQRFTRISTPFKVSPLALGGPEFLETPILQKLSQKTSAISAPPLTEYQGPVMEREKVDTSPKHAMATSSSSKKPPKRPFPFALQSNLKNGAIVLKSGITASLSEIDVTLGKAKIIDLPSPAARIAISDPSIAAAVVISPTQIQLIGKSVGVANLMVWNDTESSRYSIIDISVNRDVSVLA